MVLGPGAWKNPFCYQVVWPDGVGVLKTGLKTLYLNISRSKPSGQEIYKKKERPPKFFWDLNLTVVVLNNHISMIFYLRIKNILIQPYYV